jgi:hypothetical protein
MQRLESACEDFSLHRTDLRDGLLHELLSQMPVTQEQVEPCGEHQTLSQAIGLIVADGLESHGPRS